MGLENLFRMKDGHKRLQQKDDITHPVTDDEMELGEHDRTLSDIFQDKKEQNQFLNSFCYEQDPAMAGDIAESLANGTVLTAEQNKFLEKTRNEYNLRTAEVEKVREILPNWIGQIAENDPRIQEIVGQIGDEKTAELLGNEFASLALSDSKKFRKTVRELRGLHDLETNPLSAHLEQNVQAALSKYRISEEKYWEATQGEVNQATKKNLDKLAHEQMGFFRKAIDSVTGGSLSHRRGRKLYEHFSDQTKIIQEADKHLKAIGKVLQGTLNGDVRLAIQKAMISGTEVHENKPENNVETIDEYKAAKEDLHAMMQSAPDRWKSYYESEVKRMNISDPARQQSAVDGIKDRFVNQEYEKRNKYRASSVFAMLLAVLFGATTKDDIRNSLK